MEVDEVATRTKRSGQISGEAGMAEGAGPRITGIHHVSATVTDVEASVAWYQRLFGMDRIPFTFRHYGQEDTGYGVMLLDPRSGIGIGLDFHQANRGETFDECRTGLDHLSFGVPARRAQPPPRRPAADARPAPAHSRPAAPSLAPAPGTTIGPPLTPPLPA
jgi:catechol 2,3-dioxygenase-like lactoylglutathione lyase family enzyme